MQDALAHISNKKIVAILRGLAESDALETVTALQLGGIDTVELALDCSADFKTFAEINLRFGNEICLGAGTVMDLYSAEKVIDLGAKFILSPNMDTQVIEFVKSKNCVSIPGGFTPSELVDAVNAGADIVKFFPAINNAFYLKAMKSPLKDIPVMAVGGVALNNINEFYKAGAMSFGLGSALIPKSISKQTLEMVTTNARKYVNFINSTVDENN